jgi:hypothetical protein
LTLIGDSKESVVSSRLNAESGICNEPEGTLRRESDWLIFIDKNLSFKESFATQYRLVGDY